MNDLSAKLQILLFFLLICCLWVKKIRVLPKCVLRALSLGLAAGLGVSVLLPLPSTSAVPAVNPLSSHPLSASASCSSISLPAVVLLQAPTYTPQIHSPHLPHLHPSQSSPPHIPLTSACCIVPHPHPQTAPSVLCMAPHHPLHEQRHTTSSLRLSHSVGAVGVAGSRTVASLCWLSHPTDFCVVMQMYWGGLPLYMREISHHLVEKINRANGNNPKSGTQCMTVQVL